jgi:hypothetical protein
VIDEVPTLQKLPSLSDFLARARKYGGCGILGFQSYPQLEATYGIQDAAAITGYCSTWVALRANDTATARHVSENLGQVEQVEANEGMSYGVNDMRDGVNLSRMQVTRPLVMPTEVTNLPNLVGFLRFGRNLPVVRFDSRFNDVPSLGPAFIERTTPPDQIDKAKTLVRIAHAEARVREAIEREAAQAPTPAPAGGGQSAPEPSDIPNVAAPPPSQPDLFTPPVPHIDPQRVEDILLNEESTELPAPARMLWTILAGRQGEIRSDLVQHGRGDGPREPAKPA